MLNASLAQSVEQLIRNEQVVGSSPMRGSDNLNFSLKKSFRQKQLPQNSLDPNR